MATFPGVAVGALRVARGHARAARGSQPRRALAVGAFLMSYAPFGVSAAPHTNVLFTRLGNGKPGDESHPVSGWFLPVTTGPLLRPLHHHGHIHAMCAGRLTRPVLHGDPFLVEPLAPVTGLG